MSLRLRHKSKIALQLLLLVTYSMHGNFCENHTRQPPDAPQSIGGPPSGYHDERLMYTLVFSKDRTALTPRRERKEMHREI